LITGSIFFFFFDEKYFMKNVFSNFECLPSVKYWSTEYVFS